MAVELKDKGNEEFKNGNYEIAINLYTNAINNSLQDKVLLGTILTNRAACHLKLKNYQDCIDDCSAAIEINHLNSKAFFRRASAKEQSNDIQGAYKDLSELLHFDKKNSDAVIAMRRVTALIQKEKEKDSEVNRILTTISTGKHVSEGLKGLIGLCVDDATHAIDFIRKGGILQIGKFIENEIITNRSLESPDYTNVAVALRIFGAASTHPIFVTTAITLDSNDSFSSTTSTSISTTSTTSTNINNFLVLENNSPETSTLKWSGICYLIGHENSSISQAATSLALRCLKVWPAGIVIPPSQQQQEQSQSQQQSKTVTVKKSKKKHYENEDDRPRVELLDDDDEEDDEEEEVVVEEDSKKKPESVPMKEYDLYLKEPQALLAIRGWLKALNTHDWEAFTITIDALSAFFSVVEDYIGQEKIIDARMEGLTERKERIAKVKLLKMRAKKHAEWAVDEGALDILLHHMDGSEAEGDSATMISSRRQRASACFGRLVSAIDNDELLKNRLEKYLVGRNDPPLQPGDPLPPVEKCRLRALLEASLFLAKPELGSWALGENGGTQQLLLLAAVGDERCKEISAEVMCLASSCESGSAQLSTAVASGALQTLMRSPNSGTRAAAASALTKLSLQAKALKEDSPETSQMLNVVLDVLKAAQNKSLDIPTNNSTKNLVSFSAVGDSFSHSHNKNVPGTLKDENTNESRALTSTERAVEVLAAMVGKSFVKEELVHGSYRVAQSMESLLHLDLDPATTGRSTAPYGVAYILAAVTVTNNELRARALAEKDMSVEQYKQLQELQRVKTKDAYGNEIEEKKEEDDPDTDVMCRQRISRICALGGIPALVKLMSHDSKQTKECACRAIRQMCVEESIRGLVIQQGGLKACMTVATDEECEKSTRREAAHAIAKTLVTTNPHILSEHLRLGVMRPLIFLCREVDGTNLQQFEALLSLTNLTSCGQVEQERFVAEKGVSACHYLMFSDHLMVRRAATETLCNLASHESLLKLLRAPDKVRLWLGLSEDWSNEDNEEAFTTARAAAGTLACAASDPQVAEALLTEQCAGTIISLLESEQPELIHRALVLVIDLCDNDSELSSKIGAHLIEGGVVPPLANLMKMESSGSGINFADMARGAGVVLSKAAARSKQNS